MTEFEIDIDADLRLYRNGPQTTNAHAKEQLGNALLNVLQEFGASEAEIRIDSSADDEAEQLTVFSTDISPEDRTES